MRGRVLNAVVNHFFFAQLLFAGVTFQRPLSIGICRTCEIGSTVTFNYLICSIWLEVLLRFLSL